MRSEPIQQQAGDEASKERMGRWRRPPLLLYSYIVNELLAPFFASFFILYCVFFLIRLIPLLDIVLSLNIGLADFIRLFAYIFPHMLLYIVPLASMAGVIIGFSRLSSEREILVLKACGVSLKQMLPPVIVIAAAIACLTGLFSAKLIPIGAVGAKQLMFQLAKEKIDSGVKPKEFTSALGDIVLYVDAIDAQQRWQGVYVSDMRDRTQPLIIVAKSGSMTADMEQMLVTVVLTNGTMHSNEESDNQLIRFERYQLQVPLHPPTRIGKDDVTALSRDAMTQEQLLAAAAKCPPDSKDARTFLAEYHQRLILPVACFILSLIGLPLGLQSSPGRRAVGISLGLIVFVGYYIALTISQVLAEEGKVPLLLTLWTPNILLFFLAVFLFWRVYQERPLIPEPLQILGQKCYDRLLKKACQSLVRLIKKAISRRHTPAPTKDAGNNDAPMEKEEGKGD